MLAIVSLWCLKSTLKATLRCLFLLRMLYFVITETMYIVLFYNLFIVRAETGFWCISGTCYQRKTCGFVWIRAGMVKSGPDVEWHWSGLWNEVCCSEKNCLFVSPLCSFLFLILVLLVLFIRAVDDNFKLSKCIQIARLYLEVWLSLPSTYAQ